MDEGGAAYHLILGTRDYMAPELLSGAPPSPKTDLFALGVVAYQLLTGESFGSGAKMPSELGFPKAWDAPIVGCLYTDPADRWASVAEFQRSLEGLKPMRLQTKTGNKERTRTVQSASPLAVPLATPAPTASEPRRGGWVLPVVMALAAVALGLFWWGRERQRVKAPPLAFPEVPADERFFLAPGREGWTLMRVHPDACGVVTVPAVIGGKRLAEVSAEVLEGCRHVTELRLPPGLTHLAENKAEFKTEAREEPKPFPQAQTDEAQARVAPKSLPEAAQEVFAAVEGEAPAAGSMIEEAGALWQVRRDRAGVELAGVSGQLPAVWVVPEAVRGLPVVAVGAEALKGVEMPFERLTLPRGLRMIEKEAFAGCTIKQLALPEGLEIISTRAFYKAKIGQISFPSTLNIIGYQAFDSATFDCPVVLPERVVELERDAFARCNFKYHAVSLPTSLKRLPIGTFWKAWDIAKIDFKGVKEVPSESLTQLPDNFRGSDKLDLNFVQKSVTFAPRSLGLRSESIARRAYLRLLFRRDAEVAFAPGFLETTETPVELHLGDRVTHWDAQQAKWVAGPLQRPEWETKPLEGEPGVAIVRYNRRSASSIRVPEQIDGQPVVVIGSAAFEESQATSITLPKTLQKIENAAFIRMRHLKRIEFPPGLTFGPYYYGAWGLQWCHALEEVVFQGVPNNIPAYFFSHCKSLKRVIIRGADKLPKFIENPFESTPKEGVLLILEPRTGSPRYFLCKENAQPVAITAEEAQSWGKPVQKPIEEWKTKWLEEEKGLMIVKHLNSSATAIRVPEQIDGQPVVAIGFGAFANSQATSIVLPKTLKYLAKAAFIDMRQVKRIELPPGFDFQPSGSQWEGVFAFQGCKALEEVVFRGPITYLPPFLFNEDNIERVIIWGMEQLPKMGSDPFQKDEPGVLLMLVPRTGYLRYFQCVKHKQPVAISSHDAQAWNPPKVVHAKAPSTPPAPQPKAVKIPSALVALEPRVVLRAEKVTIGERNARTPVDFTLQFDGEHACYTITDMTAPAQQCTIVVPASYDGYPIKRVGDWAMRNVDDTIQLRFMREVYFEPQAFPKRTPRGIGFPSDAPPIFSRSSFGGKLPTFYAFSSPASTTPTKTSLFVREGDTLYLNTARGLLLYKVKKNLALATFSVPKRVQGKSVIGILPEALKDCPNLKQVVPPDRKDFTLYPDALKGTQCSQ